MVNIVQKGSYSTCEVACVRRRQGLTLSFFRYLSKGQVNLFLTFPRAQVTCPNTMFLCMHYILVQITNVITIDLIMMYPLFKAYSFNSY